MNVAELIGALYKLDTRLPVVIETADGEPYEVEAVSVRPELGATGMAVAIHTGQGYE